MGLTEKHNPVCVISHPYPNSQVLSMHPQPSRDRRRVGSGSESFSLPYFLPVTLPSSVYHNHNHNPDPGLVQLCLGQIVYQEKMPLQLLEEINRILLCGYVATISVIHTFVPLIASDYTPIIVSLRVFVREHCTLGTGSAWDITRAWEHAVDIPELGS